MKSDVDSMLKPDVVSTLTSDVVSTLKSDVVSVLKSDVVFPTLKASCSSQHSNFYLNMCIVDYDRKSFCYQCTVVPDILL